MVQKSALWSVQRFSMETCVWLEQTAHVDGITPPTLSLLGGSSLVDPLINS